MSISWNKMFPLIYVIPTWCWFSPQHFNMYDITYEQYEIFLITRCTNTIINNPIIELFLIMTLYQTIGVHVKVC